jgi:Flp pilus assembly protein TadG
MTNLPQVADESRPEVRPARRWRVPRPFRREEGQAAFEFVLILPIFLLFVLLLIDFGILMFEYVAVSNAAREGARYGSVNCGGLDCDVTLVSDRAKERSSGIVSDASLLSGQSEILVTWPSGVSRGDPVAVRVSNDYEFLFFPVTIPVTSCAEMRLEQADFVAPSGGLGCS